MGLVKQLKKLLTINMYGVIRDIKGYVNQEDYGISISSKKHFWFLDAPEYGNIGDQAIAYATTVFLQENFPEFDIIEIQQSKTIKYLNWIKKSIKDGDIIILQGGGNFGNLYPPYEAVRRRIVQLFSDNKIIIFPQSIFYSDDSKGRHELKIAQNIYNKKNVIIFARDNNSYTEFKDKFPETSIKLCPDIVLYLYGKLTVDKQVGIGVCFRNDSEKVAFTEDQNQFIDDRKNEYQQINEIDTICTDNQIIGEKRKQIVLNKINEFAVNELVLTDRLHGMIFSFVSKTPCVYFPSKTGKADYLYNSWLSESKMITNSKDYSSERTEEDFSLNFSELIDAILKD